jgi:hypothetical protein
MAGAVGSRRADLTAAARSKAGAGLDVPPGLRRRIVRMRHAGMTLQGIADVQATLGYKGRDPGERRAPRAELLRTRQPRISPQFRHFCPQKLANCGIPAFEWARPECTAWRPKAVHGPIQGGGLVAAQSACIDSRSSRPLNLGGPGFRRSGLRARKQQQGPARRRRQVPSARPDGRRAGLQVETCGSRQPDVARAPLRRGSSRAARAYRSNSAR